MKVQTPIQQLFFITSLIRAGAKAGTGFVFRAETKGQPVPVLISNKHVVLSADPGFFSIQASDGAGGPKLGERIEFSHHDFGSLWTGHPNAEVDLAAAFLGPFVNNAIASGKQLFYKMVPEDLFPTDAILDDLDAIEPVVFIGYPNGLFDQVNLTPIARRGFTATPVALDHNGLPSFLIDASVFPGSSGSPVFICQEHGYRQGDSFMIGAGRILFAGAVAAVHVREIVGQLITATTPRVQLDQILNLGIVYNWRAVREAVQALFDAHNLRYGATPPPSAVPDDVQITRQEEATETVTSVA